MSKIIVIAGPTATGKTKLSIELAKEYKACIINADSTQVYTEPQIATAKIKENEKEGITHYLIDMTSLDNDYSLFDYQHDARTILNKLIENDKNVIIVGGSGLYLKALLYDYKLEESPIKRVDYSEYTNEELKNLADNIDPNNDIHTNNRQRLERYITYFNTFKKVMSKSDDINKRVYDFILIGLKASREDLYKMTDNRVDSMFKDGLLDEAKTLYDMNLKNYSNIIGYKELKKYFEGKISLEEAKEEMKKNTRHYAKRQYTWFNNQMKDIIWVDVDYNNFDNTINKVKEIIKKDS